MAESVAIRNAFPELVKIAQKNGEVSEEEMGKAGVQKSRTSKELTDKRKKAKNQRPLHQKRTAVVNHEYVLSQFRIATSKAKKPPSTRKNVTEKPKNASTPNSTQVQASAAAPEQRLEAKAVPMDTPELSQTPDGSWLFYCARAPTCNVYMQVPPGATFVKCGQCQTDQFIHERGTKLAKTCVLLRFSW